VSAAVRWSWSREALAFLYVAHYVTVFKCLEKTVRNQFYVREEIKIKLLSGNACYQCLQNNVSCRLLSKDLNFKMCKLVSRIKGRTEAEVVREWGAEGNT
jgi:hypothetical protein